MKPLTKRQRFVRWLAGVIGVAYDDIRLDFTSGEHPAFTRGFHHACRACARELALIDANRGMSPKEKCVAYAKYAAQLHKSHQPESVETTQ